jgi:hypothetical protein
LWWRWLVADWCEVHKLDEKHDLILTSHIWREWNGLGKTGLEIAVEEWTGHATTTCRVWQHGEVIHEECSDADSVRTAKYRAVELRRTLTIARLVVEAGCLTVVSTPRLPPRGPVPLLALRGPATSRRTRGGSRARR